MVFIFYTARKRPFDPIIPCDGGRLGVTKSLERAVPFALNFFLYTSHIQFRVLGN